MIIEYLLAILEMKPQTKFYLTLFVLNTILLAWLELSETEELASQEGMDLFLLLNLVIF